MFATQLVSRFASRTAATATVRAVKRRSLIPTRAALTLVSHTLKNYKSDISVKNEKKNSISDSIGCETSERIAWEPTKFCKFFLYSKQKL